jgi:hypothetical protein
VRDRTCSSRSAIRDELGRPALTGIVDAELAVPLVRTGVGLAVATARTNTPPARPDLGMAGVEVRDIRTHPKATRRHPRRSRETSNG